MEHQDQLYEFATMGVFLDAVTDVLGQHSRVEEATRRAMFSLEVEDYVEAERCFDSLPGDLRGRVAGRAEERAHEVVVNAEIDRIRKHFSLPAARALDTATQSSHTSGHATHNTQTASNDHILKPDTSARISSRKSSGKMSGKSLTSYLEGR